MVHHEDSFLKYQRVGVSCKKEKVAVSDCER